MTADRRSAALAAFEWCMSNALRMEARGNPGHAAEWAVYAASTAELCGHSHLCSEPLEALIARLGAPLAKGTGQGAGPARAASPARWLHVFTKSHPIGGHTAIARRWIERAARGERHDVALLSQDESDVAPNLARAARGSGGRVVSLRGESMALGRARRLRELAWQGADAVVLHVHPADPVAALAFAAPGGPPVVLMNHADHAFWVGVAAADLVVDIRDSAHHLSLASRGVKRSLILPVPLPDAGHAPADRSAAAARLRDPSPLERGLVILTIGAESKYLPAPHLDFPAAALRIAREVPECAIVAVGPRPDAPLWRQLHADSGGRIVAVGSDPDLAAWHAAADLYLESFPVGSYTALLEVALAGRAFVRKPWLAPPAELPVDRGALAGFDPPETPDAYVAQAIELARDPARREGQARRARAAVQAAHCGEGWAAALAAMVRQVPARHEPPGVGAVAPLTPGLQRYWDACYEMRAPRDPFELPLKHATARGLEVTRPKS